MKTLLSLMLTVTLTAAASARDCSISKKFRLNHSQPLSGMLQDETGAPLSGLNLDLVSGRNMFRHIRTDKAGRYDFGEVPIGEYRLHVKYDHAFCAPKVQCSKECMIDSRLKVNSKNSVTVY